MTLILLVAGCDSGSQKFNGVDVTGASYGRDFSLTDHTGAPRTLADYRGKACPSSSGTSSTPSSSAASSPVASCGCVALGAAQASAANSTSKIDRYIGYIVAWISASNARPSGASTSCATVCDTPSTPISATAIRLTPTNTAIVSAP